MNVSSLFCRSLVTLAMLLPVTLHAAGFPALPHEIMTADACSSSENAANLISGDPNTSWDSGSNVTQDRWLRFDLGALHVVDRFVLENLAGGAGPRIEDYEIYVTHNRGPIEGSTADTRYGVTARAAWGEPTATGSLPDTDIVHELPIPPTIGRYVILRIASGYSRIYMRQIWIHGSAFALADPDTGSGAFAGGQTVDVAGFPTVDGYNEFRITEYDGTPVTGYEDWTPTNSFPSTLSFTAPATDTNVKLIAWFTNDTESVTLHSVTGRIAYATATPVAAIVGSLVRETPGASVRITGAELDAGSSGGLFDGDPIGIHRLEAFCPDGIHDATPGEPYVTLTQPGTYALKLRVINDAGIEVESGVAAQVTVNLAADPPAGDRFVVADNHLAAPPYDTWETAAATIQDAVDDAATVAGHTIVVWPGVYERGGRPAAGSSLTNRVTLDKAVHLVAASTNRADTVIRGRWDLEHDTAGSRSVRGVYMVDGSTLTGFTVEHFATRDVAGDDGDGGGVWAESSAVVVSNTAFLYGYSVRSGPSHAQGGTFHNCDFIHSYGENSWSVRDATLYHSRVIGRPDDPGRGSGISQSTLHHSLVAHCQNRGWGGVTSSTLYDSIVSNNVSRLNAGGISSSTAYNTLIIHNESSDNTGGAINSALINCRIIGNRGTHWSGGAGGARNSILHNCLLVGNEARNSGSGAKDSDLYNCTVVGNWVYEDREGGAVYGGNIVNSIVYHNWDESGLHNYAADPVFTHSLTYPEQPGWSEGNLTNAPAFVSYDPNSGYGLDHVPGNYRLRSGSPGFQGGVNQYWMRAPEVTQRPTATFDVGAHILLSQPVDLTGDFTVEYWFNVADDSGSWFVAGNTQDHSDGIRHDRTGNVRVYDPHTQLSLPDVWGSRFPAGDWHHFALTRSNDTVRVFRYGAEISQNTWTGSLSIDSIGAAPASVSSWTFEGRIAEVRIWDVARTETELQANVNDPLRGNESGLIGYWRLNEGEGSTVLDRSGNHNTGTFINPDWTLDDSLPSTYAVTDLDGIARIMPVYNGTVDMGAYEREVYRGTIMLMR